MRLAFTPQGWEDYRYWQATDRSTLRRVNRLLNAVLRDPLTGIGKAEQLRHVLQGCWSRRIDDEHRLVYVVDSDDIVVLQARYHYERG
ncbi:MAG: Txe/YoeB family addiction module toxin [Candidatus Dormiibacterota bacterium]